MAFGTINLGSFVYNSVGNGEYSLSTLAFSDPANRVKITPAKTAGKSGPVQVVVLRKFEKDITTAGVTKRSSCNVSVQLSVPVGFTTTEMDAMVTEISTWLTPEIINRLLMGES
jgi:hypothetical protein